MNFSDVFQDRLEDLVKQRMKRDNITQGAVAKGIGIEPQALSDYLNADNKREPKATVIYRIADYFKVSSDFLIGLSDIPSKKPTTKAIHKRFGLLEKTQEALRYYTDRSNYHELSLFGEIVEGIIYKSKILTNINNWILLRFDLAHLESLTDDEYGLEIMTKNPIWSANQSNAQQRQTSINYKRNDCDAELFKITRAFTKILDDIFDDELKETIEKYGKDYGRTIYEQIRSNREKQVRAMYDKDVPALLSELEDEYNILKQQVIDGEFLINSLADKEKGATDNGND